jgi:hypothetical protein
VSTRYVLEVHFLASWMYAYHRHLTVERPHRHCRQLQVQNRFIFGENCRLRRVLGDVDQSVYPGNEKEGVEM